MNDLEISGALALAIGWKPKQIGHGVHHIDEYVGIPERLAPDSGEIRNFYDDVNANGWCVVFDYRDWAVIGPIAEKYDCFPYKTRAGWTSVMVNVGGGMADADTPQKAIALAVIGAKK